MRKTIAYLLPALAGLVLFQSNAVAGGPSWLRLPVDGITEKNRLACAAIFRDKLKPHLMQARLPTDQVLVTGDTDNGYVRLSLGLKPVSLKQIQNCIEGSAFSIARDRLQFHGAVRLEIGTPDHLDKLLSDLRIDSGVTVSAEKLKSGETSILLMRPSDLSRRVNAEGDAGDEIEPLPGYQDVKQILAKHKAEFLAVRWGVDSDTFGDQDFKNWFCRRPFGALRQKKSK